MSELRLKAGSIYGGVPFPAYLADPAEEPSLTSSCAKTLLARSPLHANHEHPRLGAGKGKKPTPQMDVGTVIHALLLDGGQDYVACDFADWRKGEAQKMRDEIRESGRIPILTRQLVACKDVAAKLSGYIPAHAECEVTAVWESESPYGPVLCRGRLDALDVEGSTVYDLKTCEDAARASEGRAVVSDWRDMEAGCRLDALETLFPERAGRWRFVYVFAEVEPPHAVVVADLAGDLLELGRKKWRRAVEGWGRCRSTGVWPGPHDGHTRISAPPWAIAQDMELELRNFGQGGAVDNLGL